MIGTLENERELQYKQSPLLITYTWVHSPPARNEWNQLFFGSVLYMYGTQRAILRFDQMLLEYTEWKVDGAPLPAMFPRLRTRKLRGPEGANPLKCWSFHHRTFCAVVDRTCDLGDEPVLCHAVFDFHAVCRRLSIPHPSLEPSCLRSIAR
jgi:hypothetical protein